MRRKCISGTTPFPSPFYLLLLLPSASLPLPLFYSRHVCRVSEPSEQYVDLRRTYSSLRHVPRRTNRWMWKDARVRGARRGRARHVTRHDAYTISLGSRKTGNGRGKRRTDWGKPIVYTQGFGSSQMSMMETSKET